MRPKRKLPALAGIVLALSAWSIASSGWSVTEARSATPDAEYLRAGMNAPARHLDSTLAQRLSDLERRLQERDSTVYIDGQRNVHVVTSAGRDIRITKEGRFRNPKLSPDGGSIGMLLTRTIAGPGSQTYEPIEVATEVWIYRGGRMHRRFEPGGYIRAWSFANQGAAVVVYSGALHFAGFYILYDIERDLELARAKDPVNEASPDWVRAVSP